MNSGRDSVDNKTFRLYVAACEPAALVFVRHDKDTTRKQMASLQYEFACVVLISIYWGNTSHSPDIGTHPYPWWGMLPADPPSVMTMDPGTVMSPYKPQDLKALLGPHKNVYHDDVG